MLANQSIAILGLGLETLDLIFYLKTHSPGCQITVFDQKPKSELQSAINQLKKFKQINYSLGESYLNRGLLSFDIIFRSPGVHRLHPAILQAEKKGIKVSSATKLFFDLCLSPIIAVTGTKGKGTTTTLIGQILKASGKTAHIAGNIGKPTLQLLDKLKPEDSVCLELSSFQLQDLDKSPHIAVVLNITSEHLDVHQHTQEYRQAKENIVAHQTPKDLAVINADYPTSKSLAKKTQAQVYWFSRQKPVKGGYVKDNQIILKLNQSKEIIGPTHKLLLRGRHNWENITAAITAAKLAGASLKAIKQAVFSFKGLEHRLELVDQVKGVKFYNDSFSTTPETAIAALKSFTEPTIMILGGSHKGSDYTQLGQEIVKRKNLKTLILIGDMAKAISQAIKQAGGFSGQIIKDLTTMSQIVTTAFQSAQSGDVILLSPACASFDMFNNYKDRGKQFKQNIKKLHA